MAGNGSVFGYRSPWAFVFRFLPLAAVLGIVSTTVIAVRDNYATAWLFVAWSVVVLAWALYQWPRTGLDVRVEGTTLRWKSARRSATVDLVTNPVVAVRFGWFPGSERLVFADGQRLAVLAISADWAEFLSHLARASGRGSLAPTALHGLATSGQFPRLSGYYRD